MQNGCTCIWSRIFFRSHSACQIVSFAFIFIQSQEEAFVTILTPVKKCKKNGKLLDEDKYLLRFVTLQMDSTLHTSGDLSPNLSWFQLHANNPEKR